MMSSLHIATLLLVQVYTGTWCQSQCYRAKRLTREGLKVKLLSCLILQKAVLSRFIGSTTFHQEGRALFCFFCLLSFFDQRQFEDDDGALFTVVKFSSAGVLENIFCFFILFLCGLTVVLENMHLHSHLSATDR